MNWKKVSSANFRDDINLSDKKMRPLAEHEFEAMFFRTSYGSLPILTLLFPLVMGQRSIY